MSKTLLRHTLIKKNILTFLLTRYLYTFSLCGHMVVEFTTTCAIVAYHHLSCEFEPHSWRGVCDKVCQ
jgi:hypothetical protein